MTAAIAGELAHLIGLLPLLWLVGLFMRGQSRDAAWWWLATAFAVSWVADTAAHWASPDLVGNVYPASQAALIGAVFLVRRDAVMLLVTVSLVGVAAVLWRGVRGADVLLYTVSHLAVAGIVVDRKALGTLRLSLLVYFGVGLLTWWAFALWPGWASWIGYQVVRAIGLGLFCWAAVYPMPTLRIVRPA